MKHADIMTKHCFAIGAAVASGKRGIQNAMAELAAIERGANIAFKQSVHNSNKRHGKGTVTFFDEDVPTNASAAEKDITIVGNVEIVRRPRTKPAKTRSGKTRVAKR